MGRSTIWRSIFAETTARTSSDLRLQSGPYLMMSVVLFALYAVFVWYIVGEQHALAEVRDRLLLIAAPLAVFPLWWLVRLILTIPDREQRNVARVELLHSFLMPRLTFELVNNGVPIDFERGKSVRTFGGAVVSNVEGLDHIICGAVRNTSPKEAYMVTAQISELVGDNGKAIRDPVELLFAPVESKATHTATVPPNGARTLLLFLVTQRGLQFARDSMSLEYLHFFDGGSHFSGKIAIEDLYHGALIAHFTIELGDVPQVKIVHVSGGEPHRTREEHEAELESVRA